MGVAAVIRHPLGKAVDIDRLKAELSARLGRPVELLTGEPTGDDPDGVLIIEDPDTGEWLDVPPVVVTAVVAAHAPPDRRSPEEVAAEEFDAAPTLAAKLQVWRAHLGRQVTAQQQARDKLEQFRDRIRERP
jgi:hypothetical protein